MSERNLITLDYSQDCQATRELLTKAISHFPLLTSKDTDWGLGGRLYADAIANLMAVHLFKNYATTKPEIKNYTDGLLLYKLKQVRE